MASDITCDPQTDIATPSRIRRWVIVLMCFACQATPLWARTPDRYPSPWARVVRRVDGQERVQGFQFPQGSEVTILRKAVSITCASPFTVDGRVFKGNRPYVLSWDVDFSRIPLDELKPGAMVQGITIPVDAKIAIQESLEEASLSGPFQWQGWEFAPGTRLQFSNVTPGSHVERSVTHLTTATLSRPQRLGPMAIEFPAGTMLSFSDQGTLTLDQVTGPGTVMIMGCSARNNVYFDSKQRVSFFIAAAPCTFQGTRVEQDDRVSIDQAGAVHATR